MFRNIPYNGLNNLVKYIDLPQKSEMPKKFKSYFVIH